MATEAEILSKLNTLLESIRNTLDAVGATKRLTLDRATSADAAIVYLREAGDERFRVGLPAGDKDFVIQHSPDGSPLTYADVLRIDSDTGAISVSGLDINGATVSGQALFAGGSAAAPSMAFTGDPDTGLYSPGAGQISAVSNGTRVMTIDANGNTVIGGPVSSAGARLQVGNPANAQEGTAANVLIGVADNDTGFFKPSYNMIGIAAGGSEVARFTQDGLAVGSSGGDYGVTWRGVFRHDRDGSTDVGIINNVSGPAAAVRHRMIGGTGNSSRVEILADNNGSPYFTYLYGSAIESVRWVSGATEFMRYVASTGNFGFGTPSPTEKLDVNSDAIRVRGKRAPASASAAGEAGTICWDDDHIYVCTAPNTWKRAALSTW